jgi:hypothetical protein
MTERTVQGTGGGASLGQVSAEMARLYGLPDRFLGRSLLALSRSAIVADPELGGDPSKRGYESILICSVLPRIAVGLGETGLTKVERAGVRAAPPSARDLRSLTGTCLNNSAFRAFMNHPDPLLRSLTLGFANGSPITIGLDRVAPPDAQADDWVVRHTREISRARFGDERFSCWSPAMQDYPGKGRLAFKRPRRDLAHPTPDEDTSPSP